MRRLDCLVFVVLHGAPLAFEIQSDRSAILEGLSEEYGQAKWRYNGGLCRIGVSNTSAAVKSGSTNTFDGIIVATTTSDCAQRCISYRCCFRLPTADGICSCAQVAVRIMR